VRNTRTQLTSGAQLEAVVWHRGCVDFRCKHCPFRCWETAPSTSDEGIHALDLTSLFRQSTDVTVVLIHAVSCHRILVLCLLIHDVADHDHSQ
jgi:hypothetical protein